MTIRGRVVKMFAFMGTLMLVQIALVLYLQYEGARLRDDAELYHARIEQAGAGPAGAAADDHAHASPDAHEQRHADIDRQSLRATLLLIAIPLFCTFTLVYLSVDATVHTLRPMAALGRSAQHIARGEFVVPPPAGFGGEIAVVRDAFENMSAAIQRREADLSGALARERDHRTELETLKNELEAQRTELLAVIETIPTPLIIYDREGRITLRNKALADVYSELETQRDVPATIGEAQRQFVLTDKNGTPVEPDEWPVTRALRGELTLGADLKLCGPHGRVISVLVSAAPLKKRKGEITGAVVAFQDISRLLEVDNMKNDFVSVVSHELRTPLTAIRGGLQLALAEDHPLDDPAMRQLLTVALNNSERLIRIVNDILDIAKIESGGMRLERRACRVEELLRVARQSVERLALAEEVTLVSKLPEGLPLVMADFDRGVQALVNLLSNAIKFAPAGSTVTVEGVPHENVVGVAIHDEGPGISRENLARLFQKFQQVDSSTSRSVGGTGLGLVITKALIEQHGGRIEVDSEVGRGSTFTMFLPQAPFSSRLLETVDEDTGTLVTMSVDGAAPSVLIAEDDEDLRMVLTTAMQRAGFDVTTARNGRDAWRTATERTFDLLLLDLAMPEMDGFEVIRRVRASAASHDLPIIAISGSDRLGPSERRARELGANRFLAKPLDANDLVREVRHVLASSRTPSSTA